MLLKHLRQTDMYTVTITQTDPDGEPVTRYSQTLDAINLPAIIAAVNSKPPRVRNRSKVAAPKRVASKPKTNDERRNTRIS